MSVRTKCSPSVNPKSGSKRDREDGKGDELKHNEEPKKRVRIGGHPPQPDETEPETGEESEEDESPDTSDEDDDSELTSESSLIGSESGDEDEDEDDEYHTTEDENASDDGDDWSSGVSTVVIAGDDDEEEVGEPCPHNAVEQLSSDDENEQISKSPVDGDFFNIGKRKDAARKGSKPGEDNDVVEDSCLSDDSDLDPIPASLDIGGKA